VNDAVAVQQRHAAGNLRCRGQHSQQVYGTIDAGATFAQPAAFHSILQGSYNKVVNTQLNF
jgi:hypothetical protein